MNTLIVPVSALDLLNQSGLQKHLMLEPLSYMGERSRKKEIGNKNIEMSKIKINSNKSEIEREKIQPTVLD